MHFSSSVDGWCLPCSDYRSAFCLCHECTYEMGVCLWLHIVAKRMECYTC